MARETVRFREVAPLMLPSWYRSALETLAGRLVRASGPSETRARVATAALVEVVPAATAAAIFTPGDGMAPRPLATAGIWGEDEARAAGQSALARQARRQRPATAFGESLMAGGVATGTRIAVRLDEEGELLLLERSVAAVAPEDLEAIARLGGLVGQTLSAARNWRVKQKAHILQEANRLKGEMVSTLSHEMRTPLASIKGYATALLLEGDRWDAATVREFLETIAAETETLEQLVADLLEASIIDAGLLRVVPELIQVSEIAARVVEQARHRTGQHHFVLGFPAEFPRVMADPQRLEQVFHNLIDNAMKYSPEGGTIVVWGEVAGNEVAVHVADQGIGIAPEHLNRLFERYFRVHSSLGREVAGSGLGLPIVRSIVELHHGRIWAESELGRGTTLSFTLPLPAPAAVEGQGR